MLYSDRHLFFGLTGPSAFLVLTRKMAIYRISPTFIS